MQEIHPIGGRMFGSGDRRLRPHNPQSQALKCPRCDSINTKFCYYNNYNFSQPRHFCKSCRRYWTKGGVLRNVPVGGGCRKAKRSRPKPPPPSSDAEAEAEAPIQKKARSRSSSSDSSSLTAATITTSTKAAAPPPPTRSDPCSASSSTLLSSTFLPQSTRSTNPNPNFETASHLIDHPPSSSSLDPAIFPAIGSFTSLMTDPPILSYNASSPFRSHPQNHEQAVRSNQNWQLQKMMNIVVDEEAIKMQEITDGMIDQTVQNEFPGVQNRSGTTGLFPPLLDWQTSGEQNFFDLPGAVDQAYWTQNQWTADYHGHPLYLP